MKGTINRDASGRWSYQFSVSEGGKRRHVRRRGFARKRDAEESLSSALAALGLGDRRVTRAPSTVPLADHLDAWLTLTAGDLKPSTVASYRTVVRSWIAPHLGSMPLRDLTPERLAAFYVSLGERGGRGGRPLGQRSVQLAAVVLRAALDHAVEAGALAVNPATQVPKRARPKAPRRQEMAVWSAEETSRFLDATERSRWHPLWALALDSGARRGELAGLRWDDVDLDAGTVTIRRNRVVVAGKDVREGTPKTGSGRLIHLAPTTVAVGRRWKAM